MPFKPPTPSDDVAAAAAADAGAVYSMIAGQWVSSTVRAAAELNILDSLRAGPSTAAQVAEAIGANPSGVHRLMVACTSLGLLEEDQDGRFSATARGDLLADGPRSMKSLARLQGAPGVWALWGVLPDAVRTGRPQVEELLGSGYFEYCATHREEQRLFTDAMRDLTGLVDSEAARIVEFGAARDVVDVGGGDGSFLAALLTVHPGIRGVVLDRPSVREQTERAIRQAGLSDRLVATEGDFLMEVPPADYFILKQILHDWDDERARRILVNCRRAASPDARLLIVETVVGERTEHRADIDVGAMMDMTILTLTSGRERRLSEYDALLQAGGWRRDATASTDSIYTLIEARPA